MYRPLLLISTLLVFYISPSAVFADSYRLFRLLEPPARVSPVNRTSDASVRESRIDFDPTVVASIASRNYLELDLFDSGPVVAKLNGTEVRGGGDITWRGKIVRDGFVGDVILTFRKGFAAGLIYAPDAVYEITPKGSGHVLIQLDQTLFPECAGDIPGEPGVEPPRAGGGEDSGDRIDVLVVYTTATKNILGGHDQARVFAQQAIDATNTAYINSRIRQRVRLVQAEEYMYTEVSASSDLSALRSNATVQALRNEHRADMVAMIGEISGACGIGYLMGSINGNPNNAYTATARSCAVGNLSFAHELGHNMGSQHNPENGSGPTFPYGFGHWINGQYRTVMSYSNPCGSGCSRVAYFSNPAVEFRGFATGIENERDNARSINNTANVIAKYRYSGSSITLNNFDTGSSLPRNIARPVEWSSDNTGNNVRIQISRDEGTTWQTLINSTDNDGAEYIMVYGRPTRRARLRVISVDDTAVSDSSVGNISIK